MKIFLKLTYPFNLWLNSPPAPHPNPQTSTDIPLEHSKELVVLLTLRYEEMARFWWAGFQDHGETLNAF